MASKFRFHLESFNISTISGLPDRNRLADTTATANWMRSVGFEASNELAALAWFEQARHRLRSGKGHEVAELIGPMSLDCLGHGWNGDNDIVVGEHNTAETQ